MEQDRDQIFSDFLTISGLDSEELAIKLLEKHGWNLEAAINSVMDGNLEVSEPENVHPPPLATSSTAPLPRPSSPFSWTGTIQWLLDSLFDLVKYICKFCSITLPVDILYAPIRAFLPSPIPSDQSTQDFLRYYQVHYGTENPLFYQGTLKEAIKKAKDSNTILLFYLHQHANALCESFCQNILNGQEFKLYMERENVILWAGNVAFKEAYLLARDVKASSFPCILLAVPSNNNGIRVLSVQMGKIEFKRLKMAVESYKTILVTKQSQSQELNVQRMLREQQDAAYNASLKADQEKSDLERQRKKEQEESLKKEEEEKSRKENEQKRKKEKRLILKQNLLDEPTQGDITRIMIRLPDGSRLQRKFLVDEKIQAVYDFMEASDVIPVEIDYVLCSHTKQYFTDKSVTLSQAELVPSAILFVEDSAHAE